MSRLTTLAHAQGIEPDDYATWAELAEEELHSPRQQRSFERWQPAAPPAAAPRRGWLGRHKLFTVLGALFALIILVVVATS